VVEVSYRSDGISVCGWSESTTSAWNKAGDPLQLWRICRGSRLTFPHAEW